MRSLGSVGITDTVDRATVHKTSSLSEDIGWEEGFPRSWGHDPVGTDSPPIPHHPPTCHHTSATHFAHIMFLPKYINSVYILWSLPHTLPTLCLCQHKSTDFETSLIWAIVRWWYRLGSWVGRLGSWVGRLGSWVGRLGCGVGRLGVSPYDFTSVDKIIYNECQAIDRKRNTLDR